MKPSFRLKELPEIHDDYAKVWWSEHNDGDIKPRLVEYNAYMQTLDDLQNGTLRIDGIDGPELVKEIKRYVRSDFRKHSMEGVDPSNDYHRALYAFVVKRYLDELRNGVFEGPGNTTQTRPEVAQAIEDHIDELFETQMIQGDRSHAI